MPVLHQRIYSQRLTVSVNIVKHSYLYGFERAVPLAVPIPKASFFLILRNSVVRFSLAKVWRDI